MAKHPTRILTVGGGSAGHVAPVLAVIDELVVISPDIETRFWCDRGFMPQSKLLMKNATVKVRVEKILAGKFRRYHGLKWWQRLIDIQTLAQNMADVFVIILGFVQSFLKLVMWRPDVVFCKGGFVCLPVGYAATLLKIPLVIHDSDTRSGLTNQLLARFATHIATGAPLKYYDYPLEKTRYVGIPIQKGFRPLSLPEKVHVKQSFHLPPDKPLLVVIGGGLGAKKINDALVAIGPKLTNRMSVVHICGVKQYDELKPRVPQAENYKLVAFLSNDVGRLLAAADIVVSRAGATAMAELAAVKASVILVPASQLADQQKNAQVFADAQAALVVEESRLHAHPEALLGDIIRLLEDSPKRQALGRALSQFSKPQAAKEMADLIRSSVRR